MSSSLNRDGSSIYDHLEPLSIPVDMDKLAELLEGENYGTVRLLAALLRVRRRRFAERVADYRHTGDHDIADSVERRGDAIASAIERLLTAGEF